MRAMQAAYLSGDPYLEFAKQAGAVPADATKQSHGPSASCSSNVRWRWLTAWKRTAWRCGLASRAIVARDLLRAHRDTYRRFWAWSDAAVDCAMLTGELQTVFGWPIHVGDNPNPRSLRNFPMQANGAEMLRLAACFATEQGIEVCALIHDAVLICAPLDRLDADVERMRDCMAKASRIVLAGFELRTDVHIRPAPGSLQRPARRR